MKEWGYSRNEMYVLQQKIAQIVGNGYYLRNDGDKFYVKSKKTRIEVAVAPGEILTGAEGKRPFTLRTDAREILVEKFRAFCRAA